MVYPNARESGLVHPETRILYELGGNTRSSGIDHVGIYHDLHAERARTLLSWAHDIRGQDPQNR